MSTKNNGIALLILRQPDLSWELCPFNMKGCETPPAVMLHLVQPLNVAGNYPLLATKP